MSSVVRRAAVAAGEAGMGGAARVRRRGRLLVPLAAVVPLGMVGAFALTGTAATTPGTLPSNCSPSGAR